MGGGDGGGGGGVEGVVLRNSILSCPLVVPLTRV